MKTCALKSRSGYPRTGFYFLIDEKTFLSYNNRMSSHLEEKIWDTYSFVAANDYAVWKIKAGLLGRFFDFITQGRFQKVFGLSKNPKRF